MEGPSAEKPEAAQEVKKGENGVFSEIGSKFEMAAGDKDKASAPIETMPEY